MRAKDVAPKGFTAAKSELAALGVTLTWSEEWGELSVKPKGASEIKAYYTDDLQDAVGTGKLMAKGDKDAWRRTLDALPLPVPVKDDLMSQREEERLNASLRKNKGGIEAYGVKGMKNTQWRKAFKSHEAMEKWLEQNDAECQGTREAEDEGTVTWKTLPKPVHVSKPLQSVALKPGEEREVYRPRTDKELSSSFGKDSVNVPQALEWAGFKRGGGDQEVIYWRKGSMYVETDKANPDKWYWFGSGKTELKRGSGAEALYAAMGQQWTEDALPLPVPVKDFQPLGGLKCQKCGKSVSEKTRQLGGPPLCALHRAIASSSGKDANKVGDITMAELLEQLRVLRSYNLATSKPRIKELETELRERNASKAKDAAPRYKPTDCIYNPPS